MLGIALVVLVGLLLWLWRKLRVRRISPKGKTFVVTGAASGFGKEGATLELLERCGAVDLSVGRAVTKLLAEQGGYVFAVDFNQELLEKEWKNKPNVCPLRADVTDTESVTAVAEEIRKQGKGVFGLFNNAGIAHPLVPILDCPEQILMRTLNVNLMGYYRVTKALFPLIKEENERLKKAHQGTCAIVNMTSMAGLVATPMMGAYSISKHAGEALNTLLRRELRPFGIRVSVVEPFFARTAILGAVAQELPISENCWAELRNAGSVVLDNTPLLDPTVIAHSVMDALLCDPAPKQTIVAPIPEWILGKFLIHILPHSVIDYIFTDGLLAKARKLTTEKAQQKKNN